MMISLTETTRRLHIGKRRLYQMLENEGIIPTLKSGHKLLDQNQFNQLSAALQGRVNTPYDTGQPMFGNGSAPDQHCADMAPRAGDTVSSTTHETSPELMKRMTSEIEHLRQLLANEQSERREERQERENYQQMVMVLQGDMKQLRQQLLEASTSPAFSVSNPVAERDTPAEFTKVAPRPDTPVDFAEESTPQPEAVVSNNVWGSRLTAFGLLGTTMAVITFLVTINNPDLILSKAIASLWQ